MRAGLLVAFLIPLTAMAGCSVCDFTSDCYTFHGVYALRDYEGDATVDEVADALEKMGYEVVTKDASFVQAMKEEPWIAVYVRGFSNAPGPVGYQPAEDGRLRLCILYQDWDRFRDLASVEARATELRLERLSHANGFIQQLESNVSLTPKTATMWETVTYKPDVERMMRCF